MIPDVYDKNLRSQGEKEVFELFKNAPKSDDWVVLHSLGISRHVKRLYGEIDFVVLVPNLGIFCLEVKSGGVKRENGLWIFTNRHGKSFKKKVGPFEQARDGMFSLMKSVESRFGKYDRLGNLLFGCGVMFTDIEFKESGPDMEQWQVYDLRSKNKPVTEYIKRLYENTKKLLEEKGISRILPKKKDIEKLVSFLRKDFDIIVPMWHREQMAENEIIRLTEEQYACLDGMQFNKQVLFEGGAGTGKTMLAVESARRSELKNQRVLFLCYNSLLADKLKQSFTDQCMVTVSTFHGYLRTICKRDHLDEKHPDFFNRILPEKAFENIVEYGLEPYDKLILDEGQDLIRENYLDVLDLLIKGGLKEGEWQIFCDLKYQSIYSDQSRDEMLHLLQNRAQFASFRLTKNCRNTRYIAEHALILSQADKDAYKVSEVEGLPVDYYFFDDENDMCYKVMNAWKKLRDEGISPDSLTILSPGRWGNSAISKVSGPSLKIHDLTIRLPKPDGSVGFCTIHSYKGLENKYIFIVDLDDLESARIRELLYVGMTRAKLGLYLFIKSDLKETWSEIFLRRVLR
ncbi:type III restriction/modification enzyme restriction subunit [Laceyella sediminis]|uniref:Type III restriction/modification enzyme restriction subunit n=2 Tax=Laceyella sediminis TaxID=573074 RepID=A0ABX5ER04_9BACL|nr:type III restriction/modification enzyme restriction subunit [Laceyella sediminis]